MAHATIKTWSAPSRTHPFTGPWPYGTRKHRSDGIDQKSRCCRRFGATKKPGVKDQLILLLPHLMPYFAGGHTANVNECQLNDVTGNQTNFYINVPQNSHRVCDTPASIREERWKIAAWLSPLEFTSSQEEVFQRRTEGTGRWFLESREFEEWRDGVSQTLFCTGMPGAGKTAIASIVINHLQERFKANDNVMTAYIYLSYQKQSEQTATNLISSLLKQLIQRPKADLTDTYDFYQSHVAANIRPTLDEFASSLRREASKYSKVYIIVDAADELSEDNRVQSKFLQTLQSLGDSVNLLVTSRGDLPWIANYFRRARHLEIRAHDEDVRRYIESRMPHHYSEELQQRVTDNIVNRTGGMFLMARLHMDSLVVKHSPTQVVEALQHLPSGTEHTYDEAMSRIQQQDEHHCTFAYRVLSWITFACRPLSVRELRAALTVTHGMTQLNPDDMVFEECLTSYCAGLAVVDKNSGTVRLVHYTTQQYFEARRRKYFPNAQADITTACLTYLMLDDFKHGCPDGEEAFRLFLEKHHLLDYAAQYWSHHARGDVEESQKAALLEFLQSPHVDCASAVLLSKYFPLHSNFTGFSALHLCALCGLCRTIQYKLQDGEKPDQLDAFGRTPLSWAAEHGHDAVVKLLLAHEDVDVNKCDQLNRTPLLMATPNGHDGTVRLLLSHRKIDVNKGDILHQTPLLSAARDGHHAVVSILLEHKGIDVNKGDEDGQTPLLLAARDGHDKTVQKLLAHKEIDVNRCDINGRTPLLLAARYGHDETVRLLLERKEIDVEQSDNIGRTPLSLATENRQETVVNLLLNHEVIGLDYAANRTSIHEENDVDTVVESDPSPLPSTLCEEPVANRSLLLTSEEVDDKYLDGMILTPLFLATEDGRHQVFRPLLNEASPVDDQSMSLVQSLLGTPKESIIHKEDCSPNTTDLIELSPIHKTDNVNMVDKLEYLRFLSIFSEESEPTRGMPLTCEDVNINCQHENETGPMSLLFAAEPGCDQVVEPLTHPHITNFSNEQGCTPLLLHPTNEVEKQAKRIPTHDEAIVHTENKLDRSPLLSAARDGRDAIVSVLLASEEVDVNFKDENGRTPLWWAAQKGHAAIVNLLLGHDNVDLNAMENDGLTPLLTSALNRHRGVVSSLLERGATDPKFNHDRYINNPDYFVDLIDFSGF